MGASQLAWLERVLQNSDSPLLVALHHPPLAIGDPMLDAIALTEGTDLLEMLQASGRLRGLVFGHVHQHWQADPGSGWAPGPAVPLLACPSTLCAFPAVQPCPLGRPDGPMHGAVDLDEKGAAGESVASAASDPAPSQALRPWPLQSDAGLGRASQNG